MQPGQVRGTRVPGAGDTERNRVAEDARIAGRLEAQRIGVGQPMATIEGEGRAIEGPPVVLHAAPSGRR